MMGLLQSVERPGSKTDFPEEEEILLKDYSISSYPRGIFLQDCPTDLQFVGPHNYVSKFLEISLYAHIHMYLLLTLFLWRTLTDTHGKTHPRGIQPSALSVLISNQLNNVGEGGKSQNQAD